jgi:hypothetical protein
VPVSSLGGGLGRRVGVGRRADGEADGHRRQQTAHEEDAGDELEAVGTPFERTGAQGEPPEEVTGRQSVPRHDGPPDWRP